MNSSVMPTATTATTATTDPGTRGAALALQQGDFEGGIALLERQAPDAVDTPPPAGAADALSLLALAHFQLQHYAQAASYYTLALQAAPVAPQAADWRAMLAIAQGNATAEMHVHVPEIEYFQRAALLAPPVLAPGALPTPPPAAGPLSLRRALRRWLGNVLGVVGTLLVGITTNVYGRLAGYRNAVWTNWYHRPQFLAILTLAYMREQLNAHNLGTSYPPGRLVAFQPPGQQPPPGVTHFRTADGSWNDLADPKAGAAGTRFLRNVGMAAIRPEIGEQLLTPNPREISRKLLSRPLDEHGVPQMPEVPFLNLLSASWIQFMNNDWINHGEIHFTDTIAIPLPEDDSARQRYWQTQMFIGRSQRDPTRSDGIEATAKSSINEVTHWWDGSQIYGSDQATQDGLRSHAGGKLRLQADGRLPLDAKGIEETGFKRNWWVGIAMLTTLFVREHNAICDELHAAYPDWDDQRLFNVARLINAAVMAKIHTLEWTPAILPNPALNAAMHANWYGLVENLIRKGANRKTVDEINIRNAELGGVVGNPIDTHGRTYGLTEEFVEVYRLHSLLPETLVLRRHDEASSPGHEPERLPFHASRQAGSPRLTQRHAMADLFYSFGKQQPGMLVLNNYPRFMQELSIPGNPFFDMGTVDIVRARERGIPRYNEFRRQLGLHPITCFEDLSDDAAAIARIKAVYGPNPADVEKLDLMVGTLAEGHRPDYFGFGETMFQIFILNATRRLQADRFYTDCFSAEFYTPEGMRWIDATDLKAVLLRHYPQLADTGLANIRNAFEPWDSDAVLDPKRHPLRACDAQLKADPWRGDAHPAQPRSA